MAKDLVLDSIRDGVLVINANRVIVDANPAAGELLALDDIIGQDLAAAFSRITGLSHMPEFDVFPFFGWTTNGDVARQAVDLNGELRIGGVRTIAWQISPIGRPRASVPGCMLILRDEARLIQALGEVLENAITFTHTDGHTALRAMEKSHDGRLGVAIQLRDTGPGIPDDGLPRTFERFFRGHITDSGQIPGTGLGLNIAQTIIAAHNGEIGLESNGQGAAITAWLPTVVPAADAWL